MASDDPPRGLLDRLDHLAPARAAAVGAAGAAVVGAALLPGPGWLRFGVGAALLGAGAAAVGRERWVARRVEPVGDAALARDPGDVLDMVLIPPGRFMMGSPASDEDARDDERPQFEAEVAAPLWVQRCPVSNAEYRWFDPEHAPGEGDELPVTGVRWLDAVRFCNAMSARAGFAAAYAIDDGIVRWQGGDGYRLLTETEWEYACRAGSTTRYSFGDDADGLDAHAWFSGNSGGRKQSVGSKAANAFGLHDMHGNVFEWCWSEHRRYPLDGPEPTALDSSSGVRVLRGGSFFGEPRVLRAAFRDWDWPEDRYWYLGFRCARVSRPEQPVAP